MFTKPKILAENISPQSRPDNLWTVFLIDDDLDDQRLATQVLKNSPLIGDIICVSDSAMLFDQLADQEHFRKPDEDRKVLIMLDIHMPGTSGLALLEQLKSNPYTHDFPIIMLTGDLEPEKIYESYRKNASCFINKPIRDWHLTNIHTILEYGDSSQRRT